MTLELALCLAFAFAMIGWVVWDVIAPLVNRDDDR